MAFGKTEFDHRVYHHYKNPCHGKEKIFIELENVSQHSISDLK